MKRVIISTGGTGGHIYPALTLAKKLEEKDVDVMFIGTNLRMEKEIIPKEGFKFWGLDIRPFRSIKSIFKLIRAISESEKIIKDNNIDAVIGFGNYISVPALIAAVFHKKDIYLHEQNVKLGMANKLFFRFAKKIFVSFEETYYNIPVKCQDRVVMSGNPIREEFYTISSKEEREKLKLGKDEKMLLVIGGSLGAKSINEAMINNWSEMFKNNELRVYWSTGKNNYEEIIKKIDKTKGNDVIKPYFENMANLMMAADLVVSRAGASAISEIIATEKPTVLIPYNHVGQADNAKVLSDREAAVVYKDSESDKAIKEAMELVFNKEKITRLKANVKALKSGKATEKIIEQLDIWRN